jgi:Protein of unknown function (DUF559)
MTDSAIRWAERKGRLRRAITGVYAEGPAKPSPLDRARASVLATGGVASGKLAAALLNLDGVRLGGADVTVSRGRSDWRTGVRRRELARERVVVVEGTRCTDGLQTLVDLAAEVDDDTWEQALECALRRRMASIADIGRAAEGRQRGAARIRRVLGHRPKGAPPTESRLETLMVQLARRVPGLGAPERQFVVRDRDGNVRARLDLAWPELGLFVELDGQHHRDQPVYDAGRETEVVALTGWLCGRFTWDDVTRRPSTTIGRLAALAAHAERRSAAHAEGRSAARAGQAETRP